MKNKEIVKSIIVLVVICLLTSAALAVVNHFTAPVSAANAEARAQQARLDAVPDAADFAPIEAALPSGVVSAYAALDAAGTPTSYLFTVEGKGLKSVNALSLCLPYDATLLEYVGVQADGIAQMYNMTYDRLHTDGHKALYPTFVNLGEQPYAEGDKVLFTLKMRAKKKGKFAPKYYDGMLVDKYQNVVKF